MYQTTEYPPSVDTGDGYILVNLALELNKKLTEFSNLNVQARSLMQSGLEAICKTG